MPNNDKEKTNHVNTEDFGYSKITDAYLEVLKSNWAWTREWVKVKPDLEKLAKIHTQYDNNVKLLGKRIEEFENKHAGDMSFTGGISANVQGMASGGSISKNVSPKAGASAAETSEKEKKKAEKLDNDKFLMAAMMKKKHVSDAVKLKEQNERIDKLTKTVGKFITVPVPKPEELSFAQNEEDKAGYFASMYDSLMESRDKLADFADDPEAKKILEAINLKLTDPVLLKEMSLIEEDAELERINKSADIESSVTKTIRMGNKAYGEEINELSDDLSGKDFEAEKTRLENYVARVIAEKTARNTIKALTLDMEGEELKAARAELKKELLSDQAIADNTESLKEHPGIKHMMKEVKNVKDIKALFGKITNNDANDLIKDLAAHTGAAIKEENVKPKHEPEKTIEKPKPKMTMRPK